MTGILRYSVSLNAQRTNVLPHSALNGNSRSSILYPNRAPSRELFKPFGCAATLLKDDKDLRKHTMTRGMYGIYVTTSLPLGQHRYLIWVPERHRFVTANHAVFDETYFPARTFRNVYRTSSVLYPLRRTPTLSTHLYVVSLLRGPAILLRRLTDDQDDADDSDSSSTSLTGFLADSPIVR